MELDTIIGVFLILSGLTNIVLAVKGVALGRWNKWLMEQSLVTYRVCFIMGGIIAILLGILVWMGFVRTLLSALA